MILPTFNTFDLFVKIRFKQAILYKPVFFEFAFGENFCH